MTAMLRQKAVEIGMATAEDLPEMLGLVEQYWAFEQTEGFDPEPVAAQLVRLVGDPALGRPWLARVEGAAGYLLAVYVLSLEHLGLTAEIDELFVLNAHRGRGLGSRLLEAAEAEFVRAGCTKVSLQLGRGNDAARASIAAMVTRRDRPSRSSTRCSPAPHSETELKDCCAAARYSKRGWSL